MKRFMLIIAVAGLSAVDHAYGVCPTGANGKPDITSKVFALNSYDPFPGSGKANTPACSGPPNSNDLQRIKNAFNKATPSLQAELCNLSCIFVGSGGVGYSWGKWADTNYGGDGSAVIAVDTSDLNNKYLKAKMDDDLFQGKKYGKHTVVPDSFAISVMYVLAHELAHIKWRRDFASGNGNINANCSGAVFTGKSWSSPGTPTNGGRWTADTDEFGTLVDGNIKRLSHVGSDTDLLYIYNHALVTGFAANNPEEEFVETYAIAAIMAADSNVKAKLNANNGSSVLVTDPNYRGNGDLTFKMTQCVLPLLQSSVTKGHDHKKSQKRNHKRRYKR